MSGQFRYWFPTTWLTCFLLFVAAPFATAAEPYTAVVMVPKAELLSQPSEEGYVTHYLVEGAEVEVYKQSPDGWLAIRPPEGSFSWVDSEMVQLTEEPGIGEVIQENAPSWIGSEAKTIARHHSQVKLPVGEVLQLLGKRRVPNPSGQAQTWLKIAPPAGEFRWIHGSEVIRKQAPSVNLANRAPKRPTRELVPEEDSDSDRLAARQEATPARRPEGMNSEVGSGIATVAGEEELSLSPARPRDSRKQPKKAMTSRMRETLHQLQQLGDSLSENGLEGSGEPHRFSPDEESMPIEAIPAEPEVAPLPNVTTLLDTPAQSAGDADQQVMQTAGNDDPASGDGFVARKRRTNDTLSTSLNGKNTRPSLSTAPAARPSGRNNSIPMTGLKEESPVRMAKNSPITPIKPLPNSSSDEPSSFGPASSSNQEKLDQLEIELSLMLSRPKESWNLSSLQRRAELLVDNGTTPADRGQARIVLDKIRQFQTAFDVPAPSPAPSRTRGGVETATGPTGNTTRYTKTGWLKPVFSNTPGSPPYALHDRDGNRLCFVSPSPGLLNLERYVDKEVGMFGQQGYIPELSTPHLSATRVIELDRHRR